MSYTIVVARYNENVEFLDGLDNVVIYNKGKPLQQKNAVERPNVGRESESYLYHIINNYSDLPDYLVFMQGSPFDHMSGVNANNFSTEILTLINKKVDLVTPLFTNLWSECHYMYPGIKTREYYSYLIDSTQIPDTMQFAAGCQYIIPKSSILKRDVEFYKKIHEMLLKNTIQNVGMACYGANEFNPDMIDPWCLERLFMYLFI